MSFFAFYCWDCMSRCQQNKGATFFYILFCLVLVIRKLGNRKKILRYLVDCHCSMSSVGWSMILVHFTSCYYDKAGLIANRTHTHNQRPDIGSNFFFSVLWTFVLWGVNESSWKRTVAALYRAICVFLVSNCNGLFALVGGVSDANSHLYGVLIFFFDEVSFRMLCWWLWPTIARYDTDFLFCVGRRASIGWIRWKKCLDITAGSSKIHHCILFIPKKERTHLENDFTAINCCLVIMPPPVFFGQLFAEECANLSDTICLCLLV